MKKYLLLTPIDMSTIQEENLEEALEEFGCSYITSTGIHYACSNSLAALTQMVFNLDMPGNIIEYTGIYDSKEEETIQEVE
jgi:hypothetical protein